MEDVFKSLIAKVESEERENLRRRYVIDQPEMVEAIEMMGEYREKNRKLSKLVAKLEAMLPSEPEEELFDLARFKADFFGKADRRLNRFSENVGPINVALLELDDLISEPGRFEFYDPTTFPDYARLGFIDVMDVKTVKDVVVHTAAGVSAATTRQVPSSGHYWLKDTKTDMRFIFKYQINMGMVELRFESSQEDRHVLFHLSRAIQESIQTSKYFKGQILDVTGGAFKVMDLGDQKMPAIEKELMDELKKNVLNIFDKQEEFKRFKLPLKRAIILEGPPGCGKTMIARHLAVSLRGKTTVLWGTAKTITDTDDIQSLFALARKLSPSLLILEDLDLIAGTRSSDQEYLGELLNQLDGLTVDDNLVVVASTNEVKSLDKALNDRPGRFDRIYQIKRPSPDLAEKIARYYLNERDVPLETIQDLNYSLFCSKGDLSGAQIVEVCKGAIYEAIHRGKSLDDMCLAASYQGLKNQRKMIIGDND